MARAKRGFLDKGDVVYFWDKSNQTFQNKVKGAVKVEWTTADYLVPDEGLDAWGSEIPGDEESNKAAIAHHNYVVALPQFGNMIAAFSLSKTQVKRAKDFNAMIRLANLPMYARIFTAVTDMETSDGNSWANIKFKPKGVIQSKEDFLMFEEMHKAYKSDGFMVDQSDAGVDGGVDGADGQADSGPSDGGDLAADGEPDGGDPGADPVPDGGDDVVDGQ